MASSNIQDRYEHMSFLWVLSTFLFTCYLLYCRDDVSSISSFLSYSIMFLQRSAISSLPDPLGIFCLHLFPLDLFSLFSSGLIAISLMISRSVICVNAADFSFFYYCLLLIKFPRTPFPNKQWRSSVPKPTGNCTVPRCPACVFSLFAFLLLSDMIIL